MNQIHNQEELKHYGVLGMKWGVRRATYGFKSANSLRRNRAKVEKDITKLESKSAKKRLKAAKLQAKSAKAMAKGDFDSAAEYMKKSSKQNTIAAKRDKTSLHNKKLLKLYDKRISELDKEQVNKGREIVEKQ